MKNTKLVALFLAIVFVMSTLSACGSKSVSEPDTAPTLPAPPTPQPISTEANGDTFTSNAAERSYLSASEIMETAREETPALEYECPYERRKCVATMEYVTGGNHLTTWDVYLFNADGLIGTWIVNEAGNEITFYGDAYLYSIDNFNVHLGSLMTDGNKLFYECCLCVYPDKFQENGEFMVVTYPWHIQSAPE